MQSRKSTHYIEPTEVSLLCSYGTITFDTSRGIRISVRTFGMWCNLRHIPTFRNNLIPSFSRHKTRFHIWKQSITLKFWYLPTKVHGVTSHKAVILTTHRHNLKPHTPKSSPYPHIPFLYNYFNLISIYNKVFHAVSSVSVYTQNSSWNWIFSLTVINISILFFVLILSTLSHVTDISIKLHRINQTHLFYISGITWWPTDDNHGRNM